MAFVLVDSGIVQVHSLSPKLKVFSRSCLVTQYLSVFVRVVRGGVGFCPFFYASALLRRQSIQHLRRDRHFAGFGEGRSPFPKTQFHIQRLVLERLRTARLCRFCQLRKYASRNQQDHRKHQQESPCTLDLHFFLLQCSSLIHRPVAAVKGNVAEIYLTWEVVSLQRLRSCTDLPETRAETRGRKPGAETRRHP